MGGVASKTTQTEIEHLLLNVMSKETESCVLSTSSDTTIHVTSDSSVDINNINVDATESIDFQCTIDNIKNESFKQSLKDSIEDYLKTKDVAVLSSLSKNTTEVVDKFSTATSTKLSDVKLDEFKTYLENKFNVDVTAGGPVIIKNISVTDKRKLILQEIVKHADVRTDITAMAKHVDDHLDSQEDDLITKSLNVIKNLFSNPIFIIGIVIVAVVIVLFFVKF